MVNQMQGFGVSVNFYKALFSLLLLTAMFSSGAYAQSTKERISILERKVSQLERVLQNSQQSQAELLSNLQQLQTENQELRNELETLQFESDRGSDRQRQLYLDLDQRLQTLESGSGGAAVAGAGGVQAAQSDQEAYQAAFDELREGRYEPAGKGFEAFLSNYPNSDLRDNAQYWLAETHYVSKEFATALVGFRKVISNYPSSRKAADAWLKIGFCQYELKSWTDARDVLTKVVNQYPESTAARLAKERLSVMDAEGV